MAVIKVSPARKAAFEILQKIEKEKAFSAHLLPAYEEDLKPEDRALCHALTLGVLRNQIWLDRLTEHFSGKKIEKLDLAVKIALRLGIFQLRFLSKIPPRAAVNEAVNLIYLAKKRSAAGFVNAVLRKSEREPSFNPIENVVNPIEKLSVETSHPVWLLEKWIASFGFAQTAALALANNQAPPTAFRLINPQDESSLKKLESAGGELVESKIAPGAWRVSGASVKLRELVAAGNIYLQDEASQLVAHISVGSRESGVESQKQSRTLNSFLDVCAAPGSKTTLIAALRQVQRERFNANGFVVAGDVSAKRIEILRETVQKYAPKAIQIVRYDAAKNLPFADESFDCVLIDAPCSGTGTIRHNPEIRFHLRENDFAPLAARQTAILRNAWRVLKRGGRLVYSTCSLESEENELIIAEFLNQNRQLKQIEINQNPALRAEDGAARTFPQRDDTDGFYVALLEK